MAMEAQGRFFRHLTMEFQLLIRCCMSLERISMRRDKSLNEGKFYKNL